MSQDGWQRARQAQTLMQAHKALSALRPHPDEPSAVWRTYYQRSAKVYAAIAEIDRGRHHEALYWSNRERSKADELAETTKQISSKPK